MSSWQTVTEKNWNVTKMKKGKNSALSSAALAFTNTVSCYITGILVSAVIA